MLLMTVQGGSQCLCGNRLDDFGHMNPSEEAACNVDCPGQRTAKCGGNEAISVYDAVYGMYYGPLGCHK